jgi:hypothetical protein
VRQISCQSKVSTITSILSHALTSALGIMCTARNHDLYLMNYVITR